MSASPTLLEAIALKKCVTVTYNRVRMKLAPHILYKRNDSLYIDAVALEKAGQPPRELKIGAFNLAGLSDVVLADQHFDIAAAYVASADKYQDATLFAIEP
jgi:hypothetical protein